MSKAAELAALIGSQTALSNRNLIINGAMQVAQRGTSVSSLTGTGYNCLDRFRNVFDNRDEYAVTLSQSTDAPTGFSNSMKFETTTAESTLAADELMYVHQEIEAQNLQHLNYGTGSSVSTTLSFWVKSSVTGTYAVNLYQHDSTRIVNATYAVSSANTWEYKTVTFPGDASGQIDNNNGAGLRVSWTLATGSNFTGTDRATWGSYANSAWANGHTANANATTNGSTWLITGIQLEVGEQATPFEHRSYADELIRCQRYFQSTYNEGVSPGTATTVGGIFSTTSSQNDYAALPIQCPVKFRAGPSVVTYDEAGNSGKWHYAGNDRATSVSPIGASGGRIYVNNISSGGEGSRIGGHYTADAEL